MDPIETWHDAPEFERMEAKIKTLEANIAAADKGLLRASDPNSGWQGINKECKLWQERAEDAEAKLDRLVVAASMACLCRMNYSKRGVNPALEEYQAMMESLTDLAIVVEAVNSK